MKIPFQVIKDGKVIEHGEMEVTKFEDLDGKKQTDYFGYTKQWFTNRSTGVIKEIDLHKETED